MSVFGASIATVQKYRVNFQLIQPDPHNKHCHLEREIEEEDCKEIGAQAKK